AVVVRGLGLLRRGPIDLGTLPSLWRGGGPPLAVAGTAAQRRGGGQPIVEAPGQLASHYAPSKPLRLDATRAEPDEWLIGFGDVRGDASLSETGALVEAAANLFDRLHEADAQHRPRIAVAPGPPTRLGRANNARLAGAAAHR
ncbi:MAG: Sua5 family C-terminal domain-containing protein, partial [Sphingosinicella sp.]